MTDDMNREQRRDAREEASRDGLAAVAIMIMAAVLIAVVLSRII